MKKHGAPEPEASIKKKIASGKASYLRQCLYRSPFDRWLKEMLGYDPRRGWREKLR